MDGEDDVGWHWDADYEARDRGDVKHPFLATVDLLRGWWQRGTNSNH